MTASLLETVDLRVAYDSVEVLHGIDLAIQYGECVGIIGPNGCGKSTLVHTIAGLKRSASGRVLVEGRDITMTAARARLSLGVAMVPQGRRIFPQMTVEENLLMGAYLWPSEAGRRLTSVLSLLGDVQGDLSRVCGTLSSGGQQIIAIGRALMSRPRLLLLDEPLLGLSASNRSLVLNTIRGLCVGGTTIAIVEHRIDALNSVATRRIVMKDGLISELSSVVASITGDASALTMET